MSKVETSVQLLREAVQIRKSISQLYTKYHALGKAAMFSIEGLQKNDLKRAVDAVHYLGGGWPTPTSKGRMEALLDNFAGMYKVLDFAGYGYLVEEHLKDLGISVSLMEDKTFKNAAVSKSELQVLSKMFEIPQLDDVADLKQLLAKIIDEADIIQTEICQLADKIKDDIKPEVIELLGVENVEYDRLFDLVKVEAKPEKITAKKSKFTTIVKNFQDGVRSIKSLT